MDNCSSIFPLQILQGKGIHSPHGSFSDCSTILMICLKDKHFIDVKMLLWVGSPVPVTATWDIFFSNDDFNSLLDESVK